MAARCDPSEYVNGARRFAGNAGESAASVSVPILVSRAVEKTATEYLSGGSAVYQKWMSAVATERKRRSNMAPDECWPSRGRRATLAIDETELV